MKLLQEVLTKLRPESKAISAQVAAVLKKLNAELKRKNLKADAIVGGSVAKGTFLSHDHDVDLFVRFNFSYVDADLSTLLAPVVKKILPKAKRLHGSRDYFRAEGALNYEIVPVLKIAKTAQAKNVTDCSPLHVTWVKKFQKMREQIMLTKAFCKGANVYGAESYIGGFSGHVVDILTIWAGGFLPLLRKSLKWKDREVIDYYNVHKGKALFRLNKSKLCSPVIVIDPVQSERNAAAALTQDKLTKFQVAAKAFLAKPAVAYFERKAFDLPTLKQRAKGKKLLIVRMKPLAGKHDVTGAKMSKVREFISSQLAEQSFTVQEQDWLWHAAGEAVAWWVLPMKPLDKTMRWDGPPADKELHVQAFRKRYPNAKKVRGRWIAVIKRQYTKPEQLVRKLLRNPYVTERIKGVKLEVHE